MNNIERMLLNPAASLLNGYSGLVAFAEVYSGTQQRLSDRISYEKSVRPSTTPTATTSMKIEPLISAPNLNGLTHQDKIMRIEKNSLILILAKKADDSDNKSLDIVGSIELRLQPCDAKIPFSIPWLDRIERRLGSFIGLGGEEGTRTTSTAKADSTTTIIQPYLSNLCVDERHRGKKIGRALVRCVESITKTCWGYNRMYLHVDEDNIPAVNLYKSEGYHDVGHRWNPFWSGRASDIGYYVKSLSGTSTAPKT
jgi:ribosomal protein S18 acetylase RimI-like enzyme